MTFQRSYHHEARPTIQKLSHTTHEPYSVVRGFRVSGHYIVNRSYGTHCTNKFSRHIDRSRNVLKKDIYKGDHAVVSLKTIEAVPSVTRPLMHKQHCYFIGSYIFFSHHITRACLLKPGSHRRGRTGIVEYKNLDFRSQRLFLDSVHVLQLHKLCKRLG